MIKEGATAGQVCTQIEHLKRDNSTARDTYSINFDYPQLNTLAFAGYTINGVVSTKDAGKTNVPLTITPSTDTVLTESHLLSIRTTGCITLAGQSFIMTLCDITAPISEQN